MKANEVPEKIYLSDFTDTTESVFYVKQDNTKKTDFEYTRTDAFIEKAQSFFRQSHHLFHLNGLDLHNFVEDFKKYMEE